MSTFYITTPIYYVNGAPHIGHAYTTVVADVLARYYRQAGAEVFFLTGTDEHGLKIQREADKQGVTPQELCDTNSAMFRELFGLLETTHDRFIRTTETEHKATVTQMVERMLAAGDIYLAKYEGWYSASDEAYYDESEIEDGRAKSSGSPVEWVEEESYFFKLSKFQQPLLEWFRANPDCVQPSMRRNEVMAFVEGGLHDLSISRTTFSWGVPMPTAPKHVLYVWVDALTNYITGVGAFGDMEKFEKFWPCDVHLIGKDILRFHAVYWPAFLMSAGLPLPRQIFAHGWWTNEGEKMSKSKGNFIDAFELAREYDLDVLRYYLLREVPLGNDGNFVRERLLERNNAELADNLGNLVNRTLRMAQNFLGGTTPGFVATADEIDTQLRTRAMQMVEDVDLHMQKRETHRGVERLLVFSGELNQYVQETQPWKLNKEGNKDRLEQVLYHALEGIRFLAVVGNAFLPRATAKIRQAFGLTGEADMLLSTVAAFGALPGGVTLEQPEVLFTKFEIAADKGQKAEKAPVVKGEVSTHNPKRDEGTPAGKKSQEAKSSERKAADNAESTGLIEFSAFTAVEIRVAQIVTAERVEGADKLLKLTANVGEAALRTIVAGIAKSFAPEELVGRRVAMVTNLKPAKLFGIESQAMILAAKTTDGKLALATYGDNVEPGTRIS